MVNLDVTILSATEVFALMVEDAWEDQMFVCVLLAIMDRDVNMMLTNACKIMEDAITNAEI